MKVSAILRAPSFGPLSAADLANKLVSASVAGSTYAAYAVEQGREYFAAVVDQFNTILAALDENQARTFKNAGPVQVLRNAANRAKTDYTIESRKNGGLRVVDREPKATKPETGQTKPAPVAVTKPESATTGEDAAESGPSRESLLADIARLNAMLTEARAALASAEARANAAEARATTAEARAASAERALANAKAKRKPAVVPVAAAAAAAVA